MGYGPTKNGKHLPITSWKNSWAEQEQRRRDGQWPLGTPPSEVRSSPLSRTGPTRGTVVPKPAREDHTIATPKGSTR